MYKNTVNQDTYLSHPRRSKLLRFGYLLYIQAMHSFNFNIVRKVRFPNYLLNCCNEDRSESTNHLSFTNLMYNVKELTRKKITIKTNTTQDNDEIRQDSNLRTLTQQQHRYTTQKPSAHQ